MDVSLVVRYGRDKYRRVKDDVKQADFTANREAQMSLHSMTLILMLTVSTGCAASQPEGDGMRFSSDPPELQFGCVVHVDEREEMLSQALVKGPAEDRVTAARTLWRGHSRRYARDVLKFVGRESKLDSLADLKQEVEGSLTPDSILRQLRGEDYEWGVWLAVLRPHPDLVPVLLKSLKDKPEQLSVTIFALGTSEDQRAVEPLLAIFDRNDHRESGDAAEALGRIGGPGIEAKMLEALNREGGWSQVKACGALARIGTARSLPALEKLANTKGYTGALDIRGWAMRAVIAIEVRINPPAAKGPELSPIATLRGHTDFIWNVAFSADGKALASASDDKTVRLWIVETGKNILTVPGHARQMQYAIFAPDGLSLFTAGWGDDGSVRKVDTRTGKTIADIPAADGAVSSLAMAMDGKLLATSSSDIDKKVSLFDATTGKSPGSVPGANALAFSPDGKLLAASDAEDPSEVRVWDLATRKTTVTLRGHIESVQHAVFSPDGRTLATGGDWTVRVWDVKAGKQVRVHRMNSRSSGVCFSADGKWLAAGGTDVPVKLWDAASGKEIASLRGEGSIAFNKDGLLASGAEDRTSILLWRLPSSQP